MQIYNEFKVVSTEASNGQVELVWYDDTRDGQGQLVTPINQQYVLHRAHRIPMESETENWTREQVKQFWLANEVEDIYDIPQWAADAVGEVSVTQLTRVRPNR